MSDTFDHEMDALESQIDYSLLGDASPFDRFNSLSERFAVVAFYDYHLEHETEKAYLIKAVFEKDGKAKKAWIPKSQCELRRSNGKKFLKIKYWFFEQIEFI